MSIQGKTERTKFGIHIHTWFCLENDERLAMLSVLQENLNRNIKRDLRGHRINFCVVLIKIRARCRANSGL